MANGSMQKFITNRYRTTEANLYNLMKKRGIGRANLVTGKSSVVE